MKSKGVKEKEYDVYFRRNNKERFWQLEDTITLYGFYNLLDEILEKTTEEVLEIKLMKSHSKTQNHK